MADALRALRVAPGFLKTVTVHLVETSETLRAVQEQKLAAAGAPISWPTGWKMCQLALHSDGR